MAITYGNGDSDSYTPDPNTNRVTAFKNVVTGSSAFTDTGTLGWNANGSLHSFGWVDGNNSALNQSCTYSSDPLNRIAAVSCGSPWGQTFAYDAFGNVTKTGNGGTSYSATYNAQTNQVASGVTATYDANGNQMQTNFVSPMSYDANHNPVTAGSTSLTYDALGRLVEFGGKPVVYGPSGEKLAVFNGTAYTASIALPGGGEAYYTSGALTSLRRKDWLGSSRLATSWAHAVVSKAAYAPYGENYGGAGTTDLDFTGQTQSSVSTLFDFPARKYDPNAGRWTVPDPGGWSVVDPTNPQSFDRYAYVLNMPLMLTDPTGLAWCDASWGGPTTGPVNCPTIPNISAVQLAGDINMQQYSAEFDHLASPMEAFASFANVVAINAANKTGSYTPVSGGSGVFAGMFMQPNLSEAPNNGQQTPKPAWDANLPNCWAVGARNVGTAFVDTIDPRISPSTIVGAGVTGFLSKGAAISGRAAGGGFLAGFVLNLLLVNIDEVANPTPCHT